MSTRVDDCDGNCSGTGNFGSNNDSDDFFFNDINDQHHLNDDIDNNVYNNIYNRIRWG